jgi:hypothetical protein
LFIDGIVCFPTKGVKLICVHLEGTAEIRAKLEGFQYERRLGECRRLAKGG